MAADRLVGAGWLALIIGAAVAVVAIAARLAPDTTERGWVAWSSTCRRHGRWVAGALLALAVVFPGVIAYWVFDRFPNSGDEFAYLFQAWIFSHGHLWAPAPPQGDTFVAFRTWSIDGKWLSQYPPGWPLAMAAGLVVGIPAWLLNALLGGGSVAALLSTAWRFARRGAVFAGAGLYLLSPFYLLNAASYFSHVLPALLILVVCLCCLWYQRDRRLVALIIGGVLLGCIGLTRYFTLALILPALAYWLFAQPAADRPRIVGMMAVGGAPFLAFLLLYQDWVTGSPLHSTYSLISTDDSSLSFTPANVALGTGLSLHRLFELVLWSAPLLLPMYLICLTIKIRSRTIAFYDLIFPLFCIGYIFFADLGGNRYGPRYYFDALPMLFVTMISVASRPAVASGPDAGVVNSRRPLVAHAVLASALYLVTAWPFVLVAYHRQIVQREEPYRLARAQGLDHAVVIIEESSSPGLDDADLARNSESLDSSILYARRGADPATLHRVFPDRAIWAYVRESTHRPGRLDLLSPGLGGAR